MSRSRLCPLPGDPHWQALRHADAVHAYTHADTWYPAWGADDRLYSAYADGNVHGTKVLCTWSHGVDNFYPNLGEGNATDDNPDRIVTIGQAMIHGRDPGKLTVEPLAPREISSPRFNGLYPCAPICTSMGCGTKVATTLTAGSMPKVGKSPMNWDHFAAGT